MDKLLINNIPISDFDVILAENSYKSVLQYYPIKPIEFNDWAEYDGIEADLSNPVLSSRSVILNFHGYGANRYEEFINYLIQKSENEFYFPQLGLKYIFRLDTNSISSINDSWQTFSLTFIDDNPDYNTSDFYYKSNPIQTGIMIDSMDIGIYGITVLEGTFKNIRCLPAIKKRLLISENSKNGAKYDGEGIVKSENQTISLKFLMRDESLEGVCKLFNTFHRMIIRADERELFISQNFESLRFYYQSCSVNNIHLLQSGNYGIEFDFVINITDRPLESQIFLSDDNDSYYLITDDDKYLKK